MAAVAGAGASSSTLRLRGATGPVRRSSRSPRAAGADAGAGPSGSSRISRPRRSAKLEAEQQEDPAVQVRSGSTVKEVAESLQLTAPEVIKKLMELGEMATLTQTLSDEAIEVLAEGFDKKVDIVSAEDDVEPEPDVHGRRR